MLRETIGRYQEKCLTRQLDIQHQLFSIKSQWRKPFSAIGHIEHIPFSSTNQEIHRHRAVLFGRYFTAEILTS
jgi:hypothetical protein